MIQIYLNLSYNYLLDNIFLKQKSTVKIIAKVHQMPIYCWYNNTVNIWSLGSWELQRGGAPKQYYVLQFTASTLIMHQAALSTLFFHK